METPVSKINTEIIKLISINEEIEDLKSWVHIYI
jgi:hypothetical protein